MMAAPLLRVWRLSEQRLHMEISFGILRRTPSLVNFTTKVGNPKKPVRYTSIKKAKPKTIIDIGKLLLQRANDAEVNKQSVIADAALKAATQPAKPAALKQSTASSDSATPDASTLKANTAARLSGAESVIPIAANDESLEATKCIMNATPKVSDPAKTLGTSSASVKDSYGTRRSIEEGTVLEKVDPVTEITTTRNTAEALSSSELFPPFDTSLEASEGETSESTTVPSNVLDKIASTPIATPKTGGVADPIDVTYTENFHLTDHEITSVKHSVRVPSKAKTVVTEAVGPQSSRATNVPATPEGFSPGLSPAGHISAKAIPTAEEAESTHALAAATSTASPSPQVAHSVLNISQTPKRAERPLTPEVLADRACCSEILSEKGTRDHEITAKVNAESDSVFELAMTETGVSHVHLNVDIAFQNKEKISSSYEKAVIANSVSKLITVANQQTTTEILGVLVNQAQDMTEKVRDLTSKTVFEASMAQSPQTPNGEFAEEELSTKAEEADTQLDPIQRLFLDKIREYSTKSKAPGGLVDPGPEHERAFSEELAKLQRLYGNGDLTLFPEFKFPEPMLDESPPDQ